MKEEQAKFLKDLQRILNFHSAEILIEDQGDKREDLQMIVEFDDFNIPDIVLGTWIDSRRYGAMNKKPA